MITRIVLLAALLCANVQVAASAPLAPGKPSGVAAAQTTRQTIYLIGGALLVVTGFAVLIAATQHDKNSPLAISGGSTQLGNSGGGTTTTTTTTAPAVVVAPTTTS